MKTGLTFHWPDYRKVSFALTGFILLSVLLHGVAFTLFQVVYPASGSLRPPPVGVTLLTPSTPENRALLKLLDAGDPALTLKPQEVIPPGLLDLQYHPSYSQLYTEPKLAPAPAPVFDFPPVIDPQSLVSTLARPATRSPAPGPPLQPTQMRISEELQPRLTQRSQITFENKSAVNLEPAQFLVGVNSNGQVAYLFLQRSSGDAKIDSEAESMVANTRFAPAAATATSWGMISFIWGHDLFGQPSQSSQSSLPVGTP